MVKKMKNKFKIRYQDLWGLREKKYKFLETHNVENTKWQELKLKKPNYFFVPRNLKSENKYNQFLPLINIFEFYSVGGKPGDDEMLVNFDKKDCEIKISQLMAVLKINPNAAKKEATKNLLKIINNYDVDASKVIKYNYRPFDIRYSYYDERIYTRPVSRLKNQFNHDNLALLTTKILKAEPFNHIFITDIFADVIYLSNKTSTNTFVFPLFSYTEQGNAEKQKDLFDNQKKKSNKTSNIKKGLLENLKNNFKQSITYKDIFYYIYAILYSNTYRQKYNEFLKIDFPRIPFTKNYQLFKKLSKIGEKLVNLHLLKTKIEDQCVKFPISGESVVEKREYKDKRIYINGKQYFEGVEPEIWNYYIGGYQILDKWLKDKTGKILTRQDINHFLKVIAAIQKTIEIQKKIDKLYPQVEKNLTKIATMKR